MQKRDILLKIYNSLYDFFGSLNWWPGDTPFEIMLGAILTQNTAWKNVEKAINNLKKENLLEPQKLYSIKQEELAQLIKPSGYYNIKARRLKNFINLFINDFKGSTEKMFSGDSGELRKKLLNVNGIGPETADSILLYAGEKPFFVVDAYTRRVFSRHKLISEDMLGKTVCTSKNPDCTKCPISFLNSVERIAFSG
jgi:endonuclease-3 related protein